MKRAEKIPDSGEDIPKEGIESGAELAPMGEKIEDRKGKDGILEKIPKELSEREFFVLAKRADALSHLIELSEHYNSVLLGEGIAPRVERGEIQKMKSFSDVDKKTQRTNWLRFWAERFVSSPESLSKNVKQATKKIIEGQGLSDSEKAGLANAVKKVVGSTSFNVAKQVEMSRLKQRLRAIDRHEDYEAKEKEGRRKIFYDESQGVMYVEENRRRKEIGWGDIVADYNWGIKYRPDESVPDNIWRRIRKLSDVAEAKQRIGILFDLQLSNVFGEYVPTSNLTLQSLERTVRKAPSQIAGGFVAERMLESFLERVSGNDKEVGFVMEGVNGVEDARLKYDMKIRVSAKHRGVAVEGDEVSRDEYVAGKRFIGLQLYVGKGGGNKKKEQVEKAKRHTHDPELLQLLKKPVDDIVFVKLGLGTYVKNFKRWKREGKPSGGPEQYLTREEKRRVLEEVTKGILEIPEDKLKELIGE